MHLPVFESDFDYNQIMLQINRLSKTPNGRNLLLADIVRDFGDKDVAGVWSPAIDALSLGTYVHGDYVIEIEADGPIDERSGEVIWTISKAQVMCAKRG